MRRKARVSWRNIDKRMQRAVDLRQAGLSHRAIADVLAVSYTTVQRDLARWEALQVEQMLTQLADTYDPPAAGMCQGDVSDGSES